MPIFKAEKVTALETPPLLHPPLVEAIFELRWEIENLQNAQNNQGSYAALRDPAYPVMYGRLYERLKKDFPVIEDLPSASVHPETTPFAPRHRLRKTKGGYPLIQVGPGIITVNEIKGYSWSSFRSLIARVIESVIELYPTGVLPLNFIKAEMRYVNAIRFDLAKENPLTFLEEKLHTKLSLDPQLYSLNSLNERPNSLGLNISHTLEKPMGNLSIGINLGQFEGKPAFVQQTLIQSFGEIVPPDAAGMGAWLDDAHVAAENCFQVLCKGSLMDKFCGG